MGGRLVKKVAVLLVDIPSQCKVAGLSKNWNNSDVHVVPKANQAAAAAAS